MTECSDEVGDLQPGQQMGGVAAGLVGHVGWSDDGLGRLLVLAHPGVDQLPGGHRPVGVDDGGLLGDGVDLPVVKGHSRRGQRVGRDGVELSDPPGVEGAGTDGKARHSEAGRDADEGDVPAAFMQIPQIAGLRQPGSVGGHGHAVAQGEAANGDRLEQGGHGQGVDQGRDTRQFAPAGAPAQSPRVRVGAVPGHRSGPHRQARDRRR